VAEGHIGKRVAFKDAVRGRCLGCDIQKIMLPGRSREEVEKTETGFVS